METIGNKIYNIDTAMIIAAIRSWQKFPITMRQMEVLQDVVADAIMAFDATRGAALETWVCYFVPRNIKRYITARKREITNMVSLDMEISNTDGNPSTLHSLIESNENVEETVVTRDIIAAIRKVVESLPETEKKVTKAYLRSHIEGNGRAGAQIAEEVGLTRERVRQIKNKVFDLIKSRMNLQKVIADAKAADMANETALEKMIIE
jgi:RNA polymerase sigma factor (sigma-70 family)